MGVFLSEIRSSLDGKTVDVDVDVDVLATRPLECDKRVYVPEARP